MDEQEIYQVLESFKGAIDLILKRLDEIDKMYEEDKGQVDERLHKIEYDLYDSILKPAQEALQSAQYDQGLNDFSGKYGDKLSAYNDRLSPLEGEDFDLTQTAYDGYNEAKAEGADVTDEQYVDALIQAVEGKLEGLKKSLGLPEDTAIAAVQDEAGDTKIVATTPDGQTEVVAEENEATEAPGAETADADNVSEPEEEVEEEVEEGPDQSELD